MSVWTEVSGSVYTPRESHFSLKTSIGENFESARPSIKQYYEDKQEIKFSFVGDGICAAKQIQKWVDNLPKGSRVELETNIRFLR